VNERRFAVDTSCIVASVCAWHERHDEAASEIERRLDRGERMVVAAHALVESYSVLTRLPAPHRLAPSDAWALLDANFVRQATLAQVAPRFVAKTLASLAASGIGGGHTYDALIAAASAQGRATTLLTLNRRHFDRVPTTMEVFDPAG
jgi:predicted nucleic acid-binding protein